MPIRPENRARYHADWPEISRRIRFERAGGRCECTGECGADHEKEAKSSLVAGNLPLSRCQAAHGFYHPATRAVVVLTTAHLPGREIEQCGDDDLKAMCQACHNRMDAPMRRRGIWERARALFALRDLFA